MRIVEFSSQKLEKLHKLQLEGTMQQATLYNTKNYYQIEAERNVMNFKIIKAKTKIKQKKNNNNKKICFNEIVPKTETDQDRYDVYIHCFRK